MATTLHAQRELIGVWRKWVAQANEREQGRFWGDQRNERNSIIDAEALLCLTLPSNELDAFSLANPRQANSAAVAGLLNELGRAEGGSVRDSHLLSSQASRSIVDTLLGYFTTYADEDGEPRFAGGSYVEMRDGDTRRVCSDTESPEIVDAYTMAVTVSIHTLMMVERWIETEHAEGVQSIPEEWGRLRELARRRLTGALGGLLDSFTVFTMNQADWERQTRRRWPSESDELRRIRRRLRSLGVELAESSPFECGWSWGPVAADRRLAVTSWTRGRPTKTELGDVAAEAAPYFYFTVGALDGILDVIDDRVQASHILTDEQVAMATRLRTYYDITSRYWSVLAFGAGADTSAAGQWPIEDLPWVPSDGERFASDYWTLYLLRIAGESAARDEQSIDRIIDLLEELGQRSRTTRRPHPTVDDPALSLHRPGFELRLTTEAPEGDEPRVFEWRILDFAPQLLKQCGVMLPLAQTQSQRARLLKLTHRVWEHLDKRADGTRERSWERLSEVFPGLPRAHAPFEGRIRSWYITERVVEALVAVANALDTRVHMAGGLRQVTLELLTELEWHVAQLAEDPGRANRLRQRLNQARELVATSPAISFVLVSEVASDIAGTERARADNF